MRRNRKIRPELAIALLVSSLITSCAVPLASPAPDPAGGGSLAGTTWRLIAFESSDDAIGTVRPADPAVYTMTLGADGQATLRLDCNRGSAGWSALPAGGDSGSFTFGPMAMTRAYCGPTSMDARIARDAEYVRTYVLRDGRLHLNLMADAGNYVWERAQSR